LDAGTERRLAAALTDALPDAHGLTFEAGKLGTAYLSVSPSKVRAYAQNAEYAYLMFTSGTTGTPKGIAVTHANITACLDGAKGALPLFPEDRFSQMADIAFDVSVGEMFLCWTSGACLYVPTTGQSINPYRFIKDNRLTIWSSVPSVVRNLKRLDALEPRSFSCIRLALFCGEALPYSLARAWREAAHESAVINLYGPTEATIFATIGRWDGAEHDGGTVPIGTALPGMATRVEAEDGAEAAVGELLLSGPQLVSGYWNNEPATRRAFVTDEAGTTWYRTGDAVSADSQHGLIFRGRLDSQVKCRGFRIDLHEVEQVVARAIGSGFAVVVPVQNSDGLCESLVAFCDQPLEESASRKHCAEELPGYMVPSRIIQISDFPLMANGKIDRQRLTNLANCLR
jgi:amino acid adenylation domain-containing protein